MAEKYAIIQVSNGSNSVVAEDIASIDSAKAQWHRRCDILWSAPDVELAAVMIVDNQLRLVNGYREVITHAQEEA